MKKQEELNYNVIDHSSVPQHIILTKEEAEEVLKQYNAKPYQVPYIKVSDPAIKAINAKPGNVIKIIGKSSTAGKVTRYRYVVED